MKKEIVSLLLFLLMIPVSEIVMRAADESPQGLAAIWQRVCLIWLPCMIYMYASDQKAARRLRQREAEVHRQSAELQQRELALREAQMENMRRYLLERIGIADKMEQIKQNPNRRVLLTEKDFGEMEALLDTADNQFVARLRRYSPQLSESDLQLMMLLRLRLPARSLAMLYGISEKSVKQKLFLYKAKVGLDGGISLREFVEKF